MTRAERLANTERVAREQLERQRTRLAQVQALRKTEDRKILVKRRYQVGSLVEQAGLFVLDDMTLASLFALLATVRDVPNPVGVLAGLLCDTVSPMPMSGAVSAEVPCVDA